MKLTTEFECGNGIVTSLGSDTWRLDTVGDPFGYNRYFCLRIDNRDQPAATLHLKIHPDPALPNSHFMTHFPSVIWYCANDDWRRWIPLHNTWPDAVKFHDDHIELNLRIDAGALLHVATNPPWRCSDYQRWIDSLRPQGLRIESIGQSIEARPIHAIRLGSTGEKKPRLLVLAGMHASEHGGVWAARGIVEFLMSRIDRAKKIAQGFDIAVVPMLNPDGNAHGHAGGSPQRLKVNNSLDFAMNEAGVSPAYRENQILWRWLMEQFQPEVCLHFHGYLGRRRFGDEPCDGVYVHEDIDAAYPQAHRRDAYRAMIDRIRFDTSGYTAHWFAGGSFVPDMLEVALTRHLGTLSLLYEVNCGTTGIASQMQRGPQVLEALAGALLNDVKPGYWQGK